MDEKLAGRHNTETIQARYICLTNMLQVSEDRRSAAVSIPLPDAGSYWEWDMTTPNTMLHRTGRPGWL